MLEAGPPAGDVLFLISDHGQDRAAASRCQRSRRRSSPILVESRFGSLAEADAISPDVRQGLLAEAVVAPLFRCEFGPPRK
jgi:hypothetical protein